MDVAWFKAHWYYVVGGLIGVFVLYEILQSVSANAASSSGSSSSGTTDLSGGATQLQSLQASADLTDAQVNGSVETASYAAEVADNQTAAALQLGEVQTAAQLSATNAQTTAAENVDLGEASDAVSVQNIVTQGQVDQTSIEGDTLQNIAMTAGQTQIALDKINASIPLAAISAVSTQLSNIQRYSKNAGKDYTSIAPVIAEELGEQSAAAATSATAGKVQTTQTTGGQIANTAVAAVSSGIGSIFAGLFS